MSEARLFLSRLRNQRCRRTVEPSHAERWNTEGQRGCFHVGLLRTQPLEQQVGCVWLSGASSFWIVLFLNRQKYYVWPLSSCNWSPKVKRLDLSVILIENERYWNRLDYSKFLFKLERLYSLTLVFLFQFIIFCKLNFCCAFIKTIKSLHQTFLL